MSESALGSIILGQFCRYEGKEYAFGSLTLTAGIQVELVLMRLGTKDKKRPMRRLIGRFSNFVSAQPSLMAASNTGHIRLQ